jgi:hypothetical protein
MPPFGRDVKHEANWLSLAREWDEMADFADGMLAGNILAFLTERATGLCLPLRDVPCHRQG